MPTFTTPNPIAATVEVAGAELRITASDRTDTVVDVRPLNNDKLSIKVAERTEVELVDGRLSVKTKTAGDKDGSVAITIELPAGSSLAAYLAYSTVQTDGALGATELHLASGQVRLDEIDSLKASIASGDVEIGTIGGRADIDGASFSLRIAEVAGPGRHRRQRRRVDRRQQRAGCRPQLRLLAGRAGRRGPEGLDLRPHPARRHHPPAELIMGRLTASIRRSPGIHGSRLCHDGDVIEQPPPRQIRAVFDSETITVYQAYSPAIAGPAVKAGTFVAPFKLTRMTWIKPSFLWMMYRSGWGRKEGQERILAIKITRTGFEEALSSACLSHYDAELYPDHDTWKARKDQSPVRIQWDPERSATLEPLPWRSLQVGLAGQAAQRYVTEWITAIEDVTDDARELEIVARRSPERLPPERPYPLPDHIAATIGASHSRPRIG